MPTGSPCRLGGGVDRPVVALAQRMVVHHQQQDLHEAAVGGDAVDLLDRQFGVLHRHHDGGAQARLLVQPLGGDPVVHRAGEAGAHVLGEQQLHAVEAVADRDRGAERGRARGRAARRGRSRACRWAGASRDARSAASWRGRRSIRARARRAERRCRASGRTGRDAGRWRLGTAGWMSQSMPPGSMRDMRGLSLAAARQAGWQSVAG